MVTNSAINSENPIQVGRGGTGAASLTDHSVLVGSGTGAITPVAMNTNGMVLIGSNGADPVAATITQGTGITVTNGAGIITVTSTLGDPVTVPKGGTGETSLTDHAPLIGSGTNPVTALGVMGSGQLMIGSAGADPVIASPTGSNGTTVTLGAGTLDISSAYPGWEFVEKIDASDDASIIFDDIGSQKCYMFVLDDVVGANDGAQLEMEVSNNNGTSWQTSGYQSGLNYSVYNSATVNNINNTAAFQITGPIDSASGNTMAGGVFYILRTNAAAICYITGTVSWYNNAAPSCAAGWLIGNSGTTGVNSFKFAMDSGNIRQGRFRIYKGQY